MEEEGLQIAQPSEGIEVLAVQLQQLFVLAVAWQIHGRGTP